MERLPIEITWRESSREVICLDRGHVDLSSGLKGRGSGGGSRSNRGHWKDRQARVCWGGDQEERDSLARNSASSNEARKWKRGGGASPAQPLVGEGCCGQLHSRETRVGVSERKWGRMGIVVQTAWKASRVGRRKSILEREKNGNCPWEACVCLYRITCVCKYKLEFGIGLYDLSKLQLPIGPKVQPL